jgi:hypothetical protein
MMSSTFTSAQLLQKCGDLGGDPMRELEVFYKIPVYPFFDFSGVNSFGSLSYLLTLEEALASFSCATGRCSSKSSRCLLHNLFGHSNVSSEICFISLRWRMNLGLARGQMGASDSLVVICGFAGFQEVRRSVQIETWYLSLYTFRDPQSHVAYKATFVIEIITQASCHFRCS